MIDRSAFLEQFRLEAQEHLARLNQGFLGLEQRPDDRELINELFRSAHSLKGTARLMGFPRVGDAAHALEDVLESLRSRRREVTAALCDELLQGADRLAQLLREELSQPPADVVAESDASSAPTARPAPTLPFRPAPPAPARDEATVRINVERLDELLNLAGELLPLKERSRLHLRDLRGFTERAATLHRDLAEEIEHAPRLERRSSLEDLAADLDALAVDLDQLTRRYGQSTVTTNEAVADLEDEVLRLRLTPLATIFAILPRAIRDLARESGKKVRLDLEGGDIEVDRQILDSLANPLQHLARNAVDHGIELPDDRVAHGKPVEGRILVSARHRGDRVVITIADDGRGLDPKRLRAAAVKRGLLSDRQAERIADDDLYQYIFEPGFSTVDQVTQTSGRGVGMDVVRVNVEHLSGRVLLRNRPGAGVEFELEVPLSMAILRVVVVEAGHFQLAIPMPSLEQIVQLRRSEIELVSGRAVAQLGARTRVLRHLAGLLGDGPEVADLSDLPPNPRFLALVLATGQGRDAILVDRVVGENDVVLKPLGALLRPLAVIQGGAVLPDGQVVLVLDPSHLGEVHPSTFVAPLAAQARIAA